MEHPRESDQMTLRLTKVINAKGKVVCVYCGSSRNLEDDHVRAFSRGGASVVDACRACNASKGKKPLKEWLRWLKQNDPYRWRRIVRHNYGRKNPIAKKAQEVRDEE